MANHEIMGVGPVAMTRFVVIALLVTACGYGTTSTTTIQLGTTAPTSAPPSSDTAEEPPAKSESEARPDFVEVNGATLAYECLGSGSPVVIFEHGNPPPGFEEYQPDWGGARGTIEAISEFTRACIYGRRGVMGSDPPNTGSRTAADQVADLRGLIEALGVRPPVILVGYSWGGELVRLLAGDHPETVAGLVLVDSSHPDADAAFGQTPPPPQPPEMIDFATSHDQVRRVSDLADLPISVLVSGEPFPGAPQDVFGIWFDLQADLLSLSTNSSTVTIEGVSHFEIAASAEEIADAVRRMMRESAGEDA